MYRRLRSFWVALTLATLFGCSTAEVVVPLPKVSIDTVEPRREETILLVITEDLSSEFHESGQILSVFQYQLGEYLPLAIEESLKDQFAVVDVSTTENRAAEYDLVVKPTLISFDAPVPSTVFVRTKVKLELAYDLRTGGDSNVERVSSTGDYQFRSKSDEDFYKSIDTRVPDIYYYEPTSGVGANIPNYAGLAGKDVAVALRECLEGLNSAVINFLDDTR